MAAEAGGSALVLDRVSVTRHGRALLADVSLTVEVGQHWALLGPNGAGKTTLLRICAALDHPTHGTARVLGRPIGRSDLRLLRTEIGHVDPRHQVRADLTARDVVVTGFTGTSEPRPRWSPSADQLGAAEAALAEVALGHRAGTPWSVLSQGERTRALIARALAPSPQLLLLDEPATGLDVAARERLVDVVDHLRRTRPGLAAVMITHHLEELPGGTDHAALLRDGRVVAAGPVAEVLTGPLVSATFDHPLAVRRSGGRWDARSAA